MDGHLAGTITGLGPRKDAPRVREPELELHAEMAAATAGFRVWLVSGNTRTAAGFLGSFLSHRGHAVTAGLRAASELGEIEAEYPARERAHTLDGNLVTRQGGRVAPEELRQGPRESGGLPGSLLSHRDYSEVDADMGAHCVVWRADKLYADPFTLTPARSSWIEAALRNNEEFERIWNADIRRNMDAGAIDADIADRHID